MILNLKRLHIVYAFKINTKVLTFERICDVKTKKTGKHIKTYHVFWKIKILKILIRDM